MIGVGDYRLDPPDDDYDERLERWAEENIDDINAAIKAVEHLVYLADLNGFAYLSYDDIFDLASQILKKHEQIKKRNV